MSKGIIIAGKCAPEERLLSYAYEAGLPAVELYTTAETLDDMETAAKICGKFPLRYALHAPNTGCDPVKLAEFTEAVGAEVVVTHDIYWEDEWLEIAGLFKKINTRLCVENTYSIHEPAKFMRRYGLGRCLDLEHLQMECAGIFEEEFVRFIKQASHIHLTGYSSGTDLWHSHIHHSPEQGRYFLDLIHRSGYSGFIVSEARSAYQTAEEFRALNVFFGQWEKDAGESMGGVAQ
ncbi:MAG: TIM barrel protein [Nitrospirota bacterium]